MPLLRLISLVFLTSLLHSGPALAAPIPTDCFPNNRLQPMAAGIFALAPKARVTTEQAQEIIQRLNRLYTQDIAAAGGRLEVIELPSMEFGAWAIRIQDQYILQLTKGIRYHAMMNVDTYAQILCHEIGHHLGGFQQFKDSWASTEGQADYFATAKCMRRYYESFTAEELFRDKQPLAIVDRCHKQFERDAELQICARSLATSLNIGAISVEISEIPQPPPSLDITDSRQVTQTEQSHPLAQCRLDTYRAGALCTVPWSESFSQTDEFGGACSTRRQAEMARPRCWFSPAHPLVVGVR